MNKLDFQMHTQNGTHSYVGNLLYSPASEQAKQSLFTSDTTHGVSKTVRTMALATWFHEGSNRASQCSGHCGQTSG